MKKYYYYNDNLKYGPVQKEDIYELSKVGIIKPDTIIESTDNNQRFTADKIKDIVFGNNENDNVVNESEHVKTNDTSLSKIFLFIGILVYLILMLSPIVISFIKNININIFLISAIVSLNIVVIQIALLIYNAITIYKVKKIVTELKENGAKRGRE